MDNNNDTVLKIKSLGYGRDFWCLVYSKEFQNQLNMHGLVWERTSNSPSWGGGGG